MRKKYLLTLIFAICAVPQSTITFANSFGENDLWRTDTNLYEPKTSFFSDNTIWSDIRSGMQLSSARYQDEVRKRIYWYQKHKHYLIESMRNSAPYIQYIYAQTKKYHMPAEAALIPLVESDYNPYSYSKVGAVGLWQMMPGTASGMGLKINWWYDGRRNIIASTNAALHYLRYLNKFFKNNWLLAMAAYDCGEGRVQRALRYNIRHHRSFDFWNLPLPGETQSYIPKLLAIKEIVSHPSRYGFKLPPISSDEYVTKVNVGSQIDLSEAAKLADVDLQIMRDLNPGFRRWATDPDGPYTLLIPLSKSDIFKKRLSLLPKSKRVTWRHYTVHSGDTLIGIAHKFKTFANIVKRVNGLKNNTLHVGQNLLIPVAYHGSVNSKVVQQKAAIAESKIPGPKRKFYTTEPGDTLWSISAKFNVTVRQIRFWNNLGYHQPLRPGNELILWLPKSHHKFKSDTITYVVKPGDTLGGIAQRFNSSLKNIHKANAIKHDIIHVGQKIVVPLTTNAKPPAHNTSNKRLSSKLMIKDGELTYRVFAGDNLTNIAKRFHVSLHELEHRNNIKHDLIHPGQLLDVPRPLGAPKHKWIKYTVRNGDCIGSIAKRFHVSTEKLRRWNNLNKRTIILPKQTLAIYSK